MQLLKLSVYDTVNNVKFYVLYNQAYFPHITSMRPLVISLTNLTLLGIIAQFLSVCSITQFCVAEATINDTVTSKIGTNSLQTFSNAPFGLTMQYPTNWSKLELDRNSSAVLIVVLRAPSMLGSLNILGINHVSTKNATLPTLVDEYLAHLKQSGRLLQLTSKSQSTFAGEPAVKLVYNTISPQGVEFKLMQQISLIGNKTYFITYGSPIPNFPTYLPAVEQIIGSIKVK